MTDFEVMFTVELLVRFCNAKCKELQEHVPWTQHSVVLAPLLFMVITLLFVCWLAILKHNHTANVVINLTKVKDSNVHTVWVCVLCT